MKNQNIWNAQLAKDIQGISIQTFKNRQSCLLLLLGKKF